ncbi:MAG: hypothetical protein MR673_03220 [Fusobacterium perfoetens]|uniref:hypothetical protein n=1 Tax=Fusobacterium perfoetens TaxID=852 RepID=UPI0023F14D6A|nr:hypothetical protein [Fusobacterium perfoetens]MCI6152122.1 hypothetical protein [Fusobacterium perfoetens]MDY3237987.1 hypothetical protein [Fusobacterium perfoetens]
MKKLLLGALLIVGATSFGAVSSELKGTGSGPDPKKYSGSGSLGLVSRGEVVDATGKIMLIITPTVSAGADGTSLAFEHGQILTGNSSELTGKFEAKVVTGANNEIVPITDTELGVKLYAEKNSTTSETTQGSYSKTPIDLVGPAGSTLAYQLTNDSGLQGNIYRGTILSKVTAGTTPGTFLDRSGKIEVTVTDLSATAK